MSASEKPKDESTAREPEQNSAQGPAKNIHREEHAEPLFLRDRSDGRKGNAQDEKDEAGE
jgi:hypothetical protein